MTIIVHRDRNVPASELALSPDAIHVWTIALDEPDRWGHTAQVLSTEERQRADRLRFDRDRRRFVAARIGLRSILGVYLGVPAASLAFDTGPWGKPMLDVTRHGTALRFNVSHSHELALVVVAYQRDVGIDVEHIRPVPDLNGIVARFFSPAERAVLDRLPEDRRLHVFFGYWTLKEAYLKACGEGMSRRLDLIEIGLQEDEPRARLRVLDRPGDGRCWELSRLVPGTGYVAAVACHTRQR